MKRASPRVKQGDNVHVEEHERSDASPQACCRCAGGELEGEGAGDADGGQLVVTRAFMTPLGGLQARWQVWRAGFRWPHLQGTGFH